MPAPLIIDYSAHDAYAFCPASWFEKYVLKRRKKWPAGQRDDALALGTLVHEGLRVWQEQRQVEIPPAAVEEVTPTKECYNLAQELVYGYVQHYPEEVWPLILCEEALTFPLSVNTPVARHEAFDNDNKVWTATTIYRKPTEVVGLAKLDAYFYVPETTSIPSGIPGEQITLSAGWWVHEYKTKGPRIALGLYMQIWETNMQASYQCLALSHKLGEPVQGVLVNVLEKPNRYVPKRKCPTCNESYEFATWVPTGTGLYACPVCGVRKKIDPLKEATPPAPPNYFRVLVTRTEEELQADLHIIKQVAEEMLYMREEGLRSRPWTKRNCVSLEYRRECDYFSPHTKGYSTQDSEEYETPARDYRGLVRLEAPTTI